MWASKRQLRGDVTRTERNSCLKNDLLALLQRVGHLAVTKDQGTAGSPPVHSGHLAGPARGQGHGWCRSPGSVCGSQQQHLARGEGAEKKGVCDPVRFVQGNVLVALFSSL